MCQLHERSYDEKHDIYNNYFCYDIDNYISWRANDWMCWNMWSGDEVSLLLSEVETVEIAHSIKKPTTTNIDGDRAALKNAGSSVWVSNASIEKLIEKIMRCDTAKTPTS